MYVDFASFLVEIRIIYQFIKFERENLCVFF